MLPTSLRGECPSAALPARSFAWGFYLAPLLFVSSPANAGLKALNPNQIHGVFSCGLAWKSPCSQGSWMEELSMSVPLLSPPAICMNLEVMSC